MLGLARRQTVIFCLHRVTAWGQGSVRFQNNKLKLGLGWRQAVCHNLFTSRDRLWEGREGERKVRFVYVCHKKGRGRQTGTLNNFASSDFATYFFRSRFSALLPTPSNP